MDPEKPSPWVTSVPSKRQTAEPEPGEGGTVRYWVPQPVWFRGPALVAIPVLGAVAFLYTGWPPNDPIRWAVFVATVVIVLGLLLAAHSGCVTLEERGILIKLFAADRFVPYSQLSSARILVKGQGRNRETFVVLTLVAGEPIILGGFDVESMCRNVMRTKAAWERSRDDAEQPATATPQDDGGPYRGRPHD
jgi:hypothetical protein